MNDLGSITQLLVQTGSLGLVALVMLLGIYFGLVVWREVKEELRAIRHAITWFGSIIVDHKARAGDTPPKMPPQHHDPDKSSTFPRHP